jgi:hypothetical protein
MSYKTKVLMDKIIKIVNERFPDIKYKKSESGYWHIFSSKNRNIVYIQELAKKLRIFTKFDKYILEVIGHYSENILKTEVSPSTSQWKKSFPSVSYMVSESEIERLILMIDISLDFEL